MALPNFTTAPRLVSPDFILQPSRYFRTLLISISGCLFSNNIGWFFPAFLWFISCLFYNIVNKAMWLLRCFLRDSYSPERNSYSLFSLLACISSRRILITIYLFASVYACIEMFVLLFQYFLNLIQMVY